MLAYVRQMQRLTRQRNASWDRQLMKQNNNNSISSGPATDRDKTNDSWDRRMMRQNNNNSISGPVTVGAKRQETSLHDVVVVVS